MKVLIQIFNDPTVLTICISAGFWVIAYVIALFWIVAKRQYRV